MGAKPMSAGEFARVFGLPDLRLVGDRRRRWPLRK
jgi:hypothetical protein